MQSGTDDAGVEAARLELKRAALDCNDSVHIGKASVRVVVHSMRACLVCVLSVAILEDYPCMQAEDPLG